MDAPQQRGRRSDRGGCCPIAKDWKELSQRRFDQDKASDIGETAPDPVAYRRRKAG
jgi:hypothetical protein